MIFSALQDLDLHTSFTLNDAIIQSYFNSTQRKGFVYDEHFRFEAFERSSDAQVDIENFSAKMLEAYFVIPVVTEDGIRFVRDHTPHLEVISHGLVMDGDLHLDHHSLKKHGTPKSLNVTGAFFSGEYRNEPIYGYISIDEARELAGFNHNDDQVVLTSILFETALYRAMQRVDKVLLPDHFVEFQEIHELRNFALFRKNSFCHNSFLEATKVISSREDYLKATSKLWKRDFHTQLMFLSFSIAELAGKWDLSQQEIARIAYQASGNAATENANMSPINGSHYLLALTDDDTKQLSVAVRETVNGRLQRCYNNAGLKSLRFDVVYSNDHFRFDANGPVHHLSEAYNNIDGKRGYVIGAYCTLTFNDQSMHSEFVDQKELLEIAEVSEVDTWNGVFADRMKIKHAISSSLATCDWEFKQPSVLKHGYM